MNTGVLRDATQQVASDVMFFVTIMASLDLRGVGNALEKQQPMHWYTGLSRENRGFLLRVHSPQPTGKPSMTPD